MLLTRSCLDRSNDLALDAQLGKGMGIVIIGGLAYATLMTLFIVPVIYDILFKKQPVNIDTGSESLDDIPDDAAEYLKEKELEQNRNIERIADGSEEQPSDESGSEDQ